MNTAKLSQVVGNSRLERFDALIIGSGAGGSAAASILTANGKKVLILEAGANYFLGLDDAKSTPRSLLGNDIVGVVNRRVILPDPLTEPRTFRRDNQTGSSPYVGEVNELPKTVGGGAIHADLKTPRFAPSDFKLGSLLPPIQDASFADWPVDYNQLERFYDHIEKKIGVQGLAGSDPFAGPRQNPYPMPPGVPMYCGLLASGGAKKLGYHPFPYPGAVNSRPYDGRPACVDCGFCNTLVCPSSAKGSPPVTLLRQALLTGHCQLRPETRAIKLLRSASGREVTGVEAIGPDGRRVIFRADRYILAASPIESTRLLFLSHPGGIGNSSGLVGRNLMFHIHTFAVGIFKQRLHGHRGRTITHGMSDFRGIPGDPNRPLGGIVEFGSGWDPIAEASHYAKNLKLRGRVLKAAMEQSPLRDRLMVLTMQGEDAPQFSNQIDLDPEVRDFDGLPVARITYKNHPFELSARKFYSPKLLEILGAAGATYAFIAPLESIPETRHVMGTLRFGTDPRDSVCDANGKFHDLGNLYAADGSLFPTSTGYNPTLSIMALAARVAGNLVAPGNPELALPKIT